EALIVQPAGEAGRARRAVALACEKLRRAAARIARGDEADYAAHRLDVRFEAVELLRVVERNGAAESRRHGIDEHEIADIEQRRLVVDELVRRRGGVSFIVRV